MTIASSLQCLSPEELRQLRHCAASLDTKPHEHHHGAAGVRLFIDHRHTKYHDGEDLHHFEVHVVSDKHALAAHEFFHQQTRHFWAKSPDGFTGVLVASTDVATATSRVPVDDHSRMSSQVVGGWKLITIIFKHDLMQLTVDFAVKEVLHGEFEVRVMREERSFLGQPPARGEDGFHDYWQEYMPHHRRLHKQVAHSKKGHGWIHLSDVLDGASARHTRHASRRAASSARVA